MPKPTSSVSPTLDDVAAAAGVSSATVSRSLNQPNMVSQATRDRVNAAVQTLGYTPNFSARALAAKRTYTIGAIIPTMENAIFARGLQAFQEQLNARGYTLLVSSNLYSPELEAEQIKALVARGADGLLLIGYAREPSIYDYLESRKVPVLLAWAYQDGQAVPAIGFDNYAAMAELTERVIAEGHKKIGIISGICDGNDRAMERVRAIRETMTRHGIDTDSVPLIETPYGISNGETAFAEIWQQDAKPTAVICVNDVLAVGAIKRAHALGLSIPDDVSITGFDDIDVAELVQPQLTTVHVPHRRMGKLAADALIQMVETKAPVPSICLESSLCIRGSLGGV